MVLVYLCLIEKNHEHTYLFYQLDIQEVHQ